MPGAPTITAFAGLSPPWSLTSLDSNFTSVSALLKDVGNYTTYVADSGAANAYVCTFSGTLTFSLLTGVGVTFKAANANTAASTLNVNGTGAKNILNLDGSALSAGQIPANAIVTVIYDGTQWLLLTPSISAQGMILGTPVATTSGTAWGFTGLPTSVKAIAFSLKGFSTSGTSNYIIQIGDSGGYENASYTSVSGGVNNASVLGADVETTGFQLVTAGVAAGAFHGAALLTLESSANNTWSCFSVVCDASSPLVYMASGSKSLSAVLDRVQLTTVGGADTGDAGEVNIAYWR